MDLFLLQHMLLEKLEKNESPTFQWQASLSRNPWGSEISDGAMLQIIDEGIWPQVPVARNGKSEVGDWCFGLGHQVDLIKREELVELENYFQKR